MSENKVDSAAYATFLKNLILEYATGVNKNLWLLAKSLKEMRDSKAYRLLDCHTFNEFLGQPEVGLKHSAAYSLIRRYEIFVNHLKIPEPTLLAIDHSKLDIIAPVVEKNPDEWVGKAEHLSARDLINEVRKEQGRAEMVPATPPEDRPVSPAPDSYREYVRSKPCCACGTTPAQYAHFPRTEAAGGTFGIPLCGECHYRFHLDPKEWCWANRACWERYLEQLASNFFKET